jgi:hypothetical protein
MNQKFVYKMSLKRFILDSLKTKFAGIDEKVLDRIAAKAAKTVNSEEEAKTYVEDTTLQQVIDSYTDSRVTEAQDSAIKSYEKKYGLSDGKPKDATTDPENKPEPEPDNGDGILERIGPVILGGTSIQNNFGCHKFKCHIFFTYHLQEICRDFPSKPCKKQQKSAKKMFFLNIFQQKLK